MGDTHTVKFGLPLEEAATFKVALIDSQTHGVSQAGRDPQGSSCPTPCFIQDYLKINPKQDWGDIW